MDNQNNENMPQDGSQNEQSAEASVEQDSASQNGDTKAATNSEKQSATATDSVSGTANKAGPMNWYVVHAYSGFELKAKQALEERVRQHGFSDYFGRILVPQETVVELVRGQKRTTNRKFWPGYMLVEMVMNQDTWHLVKETQKVTGFLGGDVADPEPMSEEEVARILGQVEGGAAAPRARANFQQGETVKVIDGPFSDFNGTIEEVKPDKGKVKVLISIFGRATPVELEFYQIERA